MAQPTDSTFGAGFDADNFRSVITQTMLMGAPNKEEHQATFYFEGKAEYAVTDPTGLPYDLSASVVSSDGLRDPVTATCAVEFVDRASTITPVGTFDSPRATLTMLDNEYALIEGATAVKLGGDMYDIRYVTVGGLFGVDVFELNCEARSEQ